MKKTIVVTGATGTQGSSIVRVMLETGEWNVRAVTRNPDSEAAKSLVLNGVEVVYAEYDDEDSVRRAFKVSTPPSYHGRVCIKLTFHFSSTNRGPMPSSLSPIGGNISVKGTLKPSPGISRSGKV